MSDKEQLHEEAERGHRTAGVRVYPIQPVPAVVSPVPSPPVVKKGK